jgi:hypothetical protein
MGLSSSGKFTVNLRIRSCLLTRRPAFCASFVSCSFAADHAADLLSFRSRCSVVAGLAFPFAQFLNPVICSAISFDSGTHSVSTRSMAKQKGF